MCGLALGLSLVAGGKTLVAHMHPTLLTIPLFSLPLWGYLALSALALALYASLLRAFIRKGHPPHLARFVASGCLALCLGLLFFFFSYILKIPRAPIEISSFGVMLALALLIGFSLSMMRARKQGLPEEQIGVILAGAAATGLLGARLFYLLPRWGDVALSEAVKLAWGGLSSVGGLLSGALYAWLFAQKRGISFARLADAAAPAVALSVALVRIGCFLHGCDFGAPTDSFLAVTYPARVVDAEGTPWESPISVYQHSEDFAEKFPERVVWLAAYDDETQGPPLSLPVHPLPLYEAALALLLCLGGIFSQARRPGRLALWLMLSYAAARLGLELLRGDDEPLWYGLSLAQWASGVVLLFGVGWLWSQRRASEKQKGS